MTVSTHVLDAAGGRPAAGVAVRLEDAGGAQLAHGVTDADGRLTLLDGATTSGVHRLVFDVAAHHPDGFFPEVVIAFRIADGAARHHVPLLLSPFSYTTYRGS